MKQRRPSPAIVIAVLALIAAVAGTAVAADPGATTSAVSKKKVKKIANKQINNRLPWGTDDIADGAVTGAKIADDAVGPAALGPVVTRTASITVPAGSARIVSASCDPGELALSAGANWNGAPTVGPVLQAATYVSGSPEPTSGSAAGRNQGAGARTLTVSVSCLGE